MSPKSPSSLDPRAPLVLDTRDLGRRPGSMRRLARRIPAAADLHVGLVGVPVGAPIDLELRLEAVMEGVLVTGTAHAPVAGECSRCLDPVTGTIDVNLQELYAYPDPATGFGAHRNGHGHGHAGGGAGGVRSETELDELPHLDGDRLDLEPMLRDEVVLALPIAPLCTPDCPGLCPTCGTRLAEAGPDHRHDDLDPRWAVLERLASPRIDPPAPHLRER